MTKSACKTHKSFGKKFTKTITLTVFFLEIKFFHEPIWMKNKKPEIFTIPGFLLKI